MTNISRITQRNQHTDLRQKWVVFFVQLTFQKWKVECSTTEKCKNNCTIKSPLSFKLAIYILYGMTFYYKVPKLSNLSISQYYKNVLYHLLSKTVKSLRLLFNMFMSYNLQVELYGKFLLLLSFLSI